MGIATSTAIRHIIVREYKKPNPAFVVIDLLQKALLQALALENQRSVDDVAPGRPEPTPSWILDATDNRFTITTDAATAGTITTGNLVFNGNEGTNVQSYENQGGRSRQAESLRDQVLSALDQAVTRQVVSGPTIDDKMLAIVHAIPHLERIYPEAQEREAVIEAIRHEIQYRLGDSMPPIDFRPQIEEQGHHP